MMKKLILLILLIPSLALAGHPLAFIVYNQATSKEPVVIVLEALKDSGWEIKCEDSVANNDKRSVCANAIELEDSSSQFHGRISLYFNKNTPENLIGQSEYILNNVPTLGEPNWHWSRSETLLIPPIETKKTVVKFHATDTDSIVVHLLPP
jgi:hypothetical protein